MSRAAFQRKLQALREDVLALGRLVGQAAGDAVAALAEGCQDEARRIYQQDEKVNQMRLSLEEGCLSVIATQQPVAHDARLLAGLIEVATELERMGDYAKDIARITTRLEGDPSTKLPDGIPKMVQRCTQMLEQAIQAFADEDAPAARAIAQGDDEVDAFCREAHIALISAQQAAALSAEDTYLLLTVAHNLERFADRVTNICERTIFVASGELIELDAPGRGSQP